MRKIDAWSECAECGTNQNLNRHHVYRGVNRKNSEYYNMIEILCVHHHTGAAGVHSGNKSLDLRLKQKHQRIFEQEHTREEFIRIFGRNYL